MKYLIIIGFIIIACQSAFSISRPKMPTMPTPPTPPKKKKSQNEKQDPIKYYSYKVNIILNNGSSTEGTIRLKQDFLIVVNKKGDFVFRKKILFNNISEIKIISWHGQKIKKKNKTSEKPYVFYPSKYTITTTDGKVYNYSSRLQQFERFAVNNLLFGKTIVYAFFHDYWVIKGKKGYWYNSKSSNFNFNKTKGHPKSLAKITFIKEKK